MTKKKSFAARLRTAVEQSGLSQQQVADLAGVKRASLYNWMSGRCAPASFVRLDGVVATLSMRPRDLIG